MRWRAIVAAVTVTAFGVVGIQAPSTARPADTTGAPGPDRADAETGTWLVQTRSPGEHLIRWTSHEPLPVRSAQPEIVDADGRRLGATRMVSDGRGVEVRVTGPTPDPQRLDVLLAGDRLDEPGIDRPADAGPGGATDVPRRRLRRDPGVTGTAAVITSDYELEPVPMRGMPEPIEMVGHVVEPAPAPGAGDRPLVVFLHGRHQWCYAPSPEDATDSWPCAAPEREVPSERGYDYLQRLLASQGYATVSIRANGINAQDWLLPDGGAAARADLIAAHLRHWSTWATEHQVDLSRVVLVGHSRGGEGANRYAMRLPNDGVGLVGQVLLAPTNFGDQRAPYVPTVTVLPYCDGDVSDLQGQRYVDTGRELAPDDTALRSSVLLMGANHNYFNTEWTPGLAEAPAHDDWGGRRKQYCGTKHPQRLTAAQQRDAAAVLVSGAVRLFAEHDQANLALFDGSPVTTATLAPAQTWSAALAGDRDTRYPGPALRAVATGVGTVRSCRAVVDPADTACGRGEPVSTPSWPAGDRMLPEVEDLEIAWSSAGPVAEIALAEPLDLDGRRLQMRVIHDSQRDPARLSILAIDGSGRSAQLNGQPAALKRLPGGRDHARGWARSISFTLAEPPGAFDAADVRSLHLSSPGGRARVWLRDLATVGMAYPGADPQRLPQIDIGTVRVAEGDGAGPGVAAVPWTVTGAIPSGARFRAVIQGSRRSTSIDVAVPPGARSGTIPVRFSRNNTHDDYRVIREVSAHAISGATVTGYLGRVRIIDDDPAPKVRARLGRSRVPEGGLITVDLRLSAPVTEARYYLYSFARTADPAVRVGDLEARWRSRVYLNDPATTPLRTAAFEGVVKIRRGKTHARLQIPVARDRLREGTETLRITLRGKNLRRTLTVRMTDD